MRQFTVILFLSCCLHAQAGPWQPEARLLEAVRQIESGGGLYLYGDNGRSLGPFQMSKGAWADVSRQREARALPTFSYQPGVMDAKTSRLYAADYLTLLHDQLLKKINREPNAQEIYAAYNMGLGRFSEKYGCNLNRLDPATAQKCKRLQALLQ
jgi:hypothetical protein